MFGSDEGDNNTEGKVIVKDEPRSEGQEDDNIVVSQGNSTGLKVNLKQIGFCCTGDPALQSSQGRGQSKAAG